MSADTAAPIQFAGFFLEWDRIEDDKAELAEQSKDLSKAMKDQGYNPPAARVVFREMRIMRNASLEDIAKAEANEADVDLYRSALARGLEARAHPAPAREKTFDNFGSYAEEKGVEPRGFIASLSDEQKAAAVAYRGDDTHGAESTQEQPAEPATTNPASRVLEVMGGNLSIPSTDAGGEDRAADAGHINAQSEQAAPHSHLPAQAPHALQADKTSEAVCSSPASLAPPAGTKHTETNFSSDPLNDAPSADADQAGAIVGHPMSAVAPAAIPDDDVPAFLRKDAAVDVKSPEFIKHLRPFCQHLDDCHGHGRECSKCRAARAA